MFKNTSSWSVAVLFVAFWSSSRAAISAVGDGMEPPKEHGGVKDALLRDQDRKMSIAFTTRKSLPAE